MRPSKPVDLILLEKKSHRTKAELEHRRKGEEALYTGESFMESAQVRADPIAHKEFLRLKRLYKNISYVDALDQQVINRYCLEVSALTRLEQTVSALYVELDNAENYEARIRIYSLINDTTTKTNKAKEMLLKYEDRLFLNPTARIKSIPKNPEKKEELSGMASFIARRGSGD